MGIVSTILKGVAGAAVGFFLGGPAGAVLGAGIAIGGSYALQALAPDLPDFNSANERSLENFVAPEAPRRVVYGFTLIGAQQVWEAVVDDPTELPELKDALWYVDLRLADHTLDSVMGVKINDDFLTVGQDLVLNNNPRLDPDLPTNWWVPRTGNKYRRDDLADSGSSGKNRWHAAFKFINRDERVADPHLVSLNAGYDDNRIHVGVSHVVAGFRVNPELKLGGRRPDIKFLVAGKNDIWDPRSGTHRFTRNQALILADYAMWRWGKLQLSRDDILMDYLRDAANICAEPIPGQSSTKFKFLCDGVVEASEDPSQVMNSMAVNMAGGYFWRGDKLAIFAGGPVKQTRRIFRKNVVLHLDQHDYANVITDADGNENRESIKYRRRLSASDRFNTLVVHFVGRRDADGNPIFQPKPTEPITDPSWVAEDNGVELSTDLKLRFCTDNVRAQYVGWILARQNRLETTLSAPFRLRMIELEPGDVTLLTDEEIGAVGKPFWVTDRTIDLQNSRVHLNMQAFDDGVYAAPGTIAPEVFAPVRFGSDMRPLFVRGNVPGVSGTPGGAITQLITVGEDPDGGFFEIDGRLRRIRVVDNQGIERLMFGKFSSTQGDYGLRVTKADGTTAFVVNASQAALDVPLTVERADIVDLAISNAALVQVKDVTFVDTFNPNLVNDVFVIARDVIETSTARGAYVWGMLDCEIEYNSASNVFNNDVVELRLLRTRAPGAELVRKWEFVDLVPYGLNVDTNNIFGRILLPIFFADVSPPSGNNAYNLQMRFFSGGADVNGEYRFVVNRLDLAVLGIFK